MSDLLLTTNLSFFEEYDYTESRGSILRHKDNFEDLSYYLDSDLLITDFYHDTSEEWISTLRTYDTDLCITDKVHSIYDSECTDLVIISDLYRLYIIDKYLDEYSYVLYIDYDTYFKRNILPEVKIHIQGSDPRLLTYPCYDLTTGGKYYRNNSNAFLLTKFKLLPYFNEYLNYLDRKGLPRSTRSVYGPDFMNYMINRTNLVTSTSKIMVLATNKDIFFKGTEMYSEFMNTNTTGCLSMSFMNRDYWSELV